jgi:hypothetical protein
MTMSNSPIAQTLVVPLSVEMVEKIVDRLPKGMLAEENHAPQALFVKGPVESLARSSGKNRNNPARRVLSRNGSAVDKMSSWRSATAGSSAVTAGLADETPTGRPTFGS